VQSSGYGSFYVPLLSTANVRKISNFVDEFRPDIVHVHDPALLGVIAQFWAKLHGVPVFYTAHIIPSRALDFGAMEAVHISPGPINDALARAYLLTFYMNCDAVIGLNEGIAAEIRDFGYTGTIYLIPNGRNLNLYHTCEFADNSSAEKHLTFVGFLSKRKNQAFLLEALRHLPGNYHLQLIGETITADYREALEQQARNRRLHVTFAGKLDQNDVAAVLEKTHVFVSASKMEVQSLVIIEALASGTPVVGLANQTVDELIDSSNGIALPKDASPEAFAAAIKRLCELPAADYRRLCESARSRVKDLDWSRVMVKTVQSYATSLAKHAETPEPVGSQELLLRYVAQIPAGKLHDRILEIVSGLVLPPSNRRVVNAKVVGLAGLNMAASAVLYYALKGPVRLIRRYAKWSSGTPPRAKREPGGSGGS
jgi:glycosyltransferase involved in cell wall biosynthesis